MTEYLRVGVYYVVLFRRCDVLSERLLRSLYHINSLLLTVSRSMFSVYVG